MVNLLLPTLSDARATRPADRVTAETVLVASFGDPVAAAYARQVEGGRVEIVDLTQPDRLARLLSAPVAACVLFLQPRLTTTDRNALAALVPVLQQATFIGVVSGLGVHLHDAEAAEVEAHVLRLFKDLPARPVVFRTGHILGAPSPFARRLRRFGFVYPLLPRGWRHCFVDAEQIFHAIDEARQTRSSRRLITLLGRNRPWRDVLREQRSRGLLPSLVTGVCLLLAIFLVGLVVARLIALLCWRGRSRHFDTLRPKSFAELLALCNRHNMRHVKIVGYNNGVIHFGHRYPGKTIVSTVSCKRILRTGADIVRADCGTTIRDMRQFLATAGQELYVVPNYSYVCLGTAFFVPIHGSASDYTTVADTIEKALLYDPARDRFLLVTRDEPEFHEHVYNMASRVLLLRLWIRVKPKTRYFVRTEQWTDPGGEQLLGALRDPEASNVEIRKSKAATSQVRVATYFTAKKLHPLSGEAAQLAPLSPGCNVPKACNDVAAGGEGMGVRGEDTRLTGEVLEVPRDSLGRLWDRLEENAFTSFLMHAATRYFAWHVELFFSADEFLTFWKTHKDLPLRKMQLRYIRRDGLPHSPFRDHDCVSVDLFMLRWHRQRFETYLKNTFAVVRTNPGKHSQ